MSGSWVAGTTRAKALASRRLGSAAARDLAAEPSFGAAIETLAMSPYGRAVRSGQSLEEAQQAVAETLLWNLRVLAGWLPGPGVEVLRVLSGWFEIANVDQQIHAFEEGVQGSFFALGGLSTAWPRLAEAADLHSVREVLATSRWGDPQEAVPRVIRMRMLSIWAASVYALKVPVARSWAMGAAAIQVARLVFLQQQTIPDSALVQLAFVLPGIDRTTKGDLPSFVSTLPAQSRALFDAAASGADPLAVALWRAEAHWWRVLERESLALLRTSAFGAESIVGAVGLLAADAWRVRAALGSAAHGTRGREIFDALA